MTPTTLNEWSEAVVSAVGVVHSIPQEWRLPGDLPEMSHRGWASMIEFSPDDLVVTVQAGMTIGELQSELAQAGRRLPIGGTPLPLDSWTVAETISISPPHADEFTLGGWRDWVLGGKLLMADGRIVKVGSRAVKNVAGYDVQKLIVGSRGTLAVVLEVTLLVAPMRDPTPLPILGGDLPWYLQRVSITDGPALGESAAEVAHVFHADTGTLWARTDRELPRFAGDWVMRGGALRPSSPGEARLWRRAKEQFDPRNVLNPGYLEVDDE